MQQLLPTFTIVFCSISLLVRVLWQRVRMRQTIHWKKHRKMAIQVLSISCVYLLLLLPYAIVYIVRSYTSLSSQLFTELFVSMGFANYFIPLIFPFVCALSLPELQKKVKDLLHLRQSQQIQPIATVQTRSHPAGNTRQT
ncbi:unnamed protein product [Adineta ricciae]|uniref:G-protein coupled receptors family 1 profile domain-containing protein n=1 Tax=Adineta ricciae TaxID=249248 RepID=A0A815LT15_ADIRI|nr:unnamed protein product [Adineta ricciae]CAF1444753.1 unnamed protein product [Adineta ricciae]